jgi:sugar phosphate permease
MPYKWELVALLWFAFFFNRADRQIYSFVMPQIQSDLRLSDTQLGLVASIFTWTYGLLVPFGGYFGDLLRRKWVIVFSLLLWSAATLCTGLSFGFLSLAFLRGIATGGGESFYYPSATSLISQFHNRARALALSIHQTSLYVGVVVSGLIVGWIAQTYGWRHAFYVFGIGGIVLALIMLWRLKDPPHESETVENETEPACPQAAPAGRIPVPVVLRELLRKRTVLFLGLAFAGQAFVDIGYVTWCPTYLQQQFRMSPASAGFASMFYHHLFAFIGILIVGRFTDTFSRRRRSIRIEAQIVGMLCGAPFIFMMGMGQTKLSCIIGMSLFGLFRGVYESNLYATLFEVIGRRLRSSAVGVMICFAFLVGAFAPLLLGALKHRFGLGAGLAGLSAVYVFSATMLLIGWAMFFRRDCVGVSSEI